MFMTNPISSSTRATRFLPMVFALAVIFFCSSLPSIAQPPPNPQQQPTLNTGRSRSLGEHISALNVRARQLVQVLQTEMLRLTRWVDYFAWLLALLLIPASAVREWHENAGKGRNLFWWFGRLAVCLMLFGMTMPIIDALYVVGKDIAEGNESISGQAGQSLLFEFYSTQRESFNASYDKLIDGNFKVKGLNGQEFAIQPVDGTEAFLGVIYDQSSTIRDLQSNLNDSSYTMPTLFALMGIARGVMEAGDVWLIVLAGLLLLTFKLLAPLMVVLGIDRKLSQRTVTAFVWGLVIFTLVWPSVSYILRALAYMGGNLAMAMGDADQVYAWTDSAQKALRNPLAQPFYTVVVGALTMFGAGLALWVSPFLAYSFAMGRVFEGVSQQASQIAGSIIGTAMEWVSANVGARIARQADNVQLQGAYDAERERARGELDFANVGAQSRRIQSIAQAKAQQASGLGNVWSAWAFQRGSAKNQEMFAINAAEGQAIYSKALDSNRAAREMRDNIVNGVQQEKNIAAQAIGETYHNAGSAAGTAGITTGNAKAIGIGHGANLIGIEEKYRLQTKAADEATNKRSDNIKTYYDNLVGAPDQPGIHDQYRDFASANQQALAKTQLSTSDVSLNMARDGVNRAAGIQIGTAKQVARIETEANQGRFDAQMRAADLTYSAGVQTANLRAMQHVLSQVASKVARDIEKGIEMRF
jgi:hypothetical protein